MAFFKGQKVICLPDPPETWAEWWYRIHHPTRYALPVIGEIYTVANIYTAPDGTACLELVEIYAPNEPGRWLPGFLADGFRPAVERKTDISIFKKLLAPKRRRELADV